MDCNESGTVTELPVNRSSAYHSADGSAACAHGKDEDELSWAGSDLLFDQERGSEEDKEITCPGRETPEEALKARQLSGDNAGDEAGENVDYVDSDLDLRLG